MKYNSKIQLVNSTQLREKCEEDEEVISEKIIILLRKKFLV